MHRQCDIARVRVHRRGCRVGRLHRPRSHRHKQVPPHSPERTGRDARSRGVRAPRQRARLAGGLCSNGPPGLPQRWHLCGGHRPAQCPEGHLLRHDRPRQRPRPDLPARSCRRLTCSRRRRARIMDRQPAAGFGRNGRILFSPRLALHGRQRCGKSRGCSSATWGGQPTQCNDRRLCAGRDQGRGGRDSGEPRCLLRGRDCLCDLHHARPTRCSHSRWRRGGRA